MNVTLTRKDTELILIALSGMADETRSYAAQLTNNLEELHSRIFDQYNEEMKRS